MQENTFNPIVVTMDVKSLYSNISYRKDTKAVSKTLSYQSDQPLETNVIIKFLFPELSV